MAAKSNRNLERRIDGFYSVCEDFDADVDLWMFRL
jgi:hypothetical protein